MLVIKLLSVIVILCAIILLIQLLQLCMMSKTSTGQDGFSIERFEEEAPPPLEEEGEEDRDIVGKEAVATDSSTPSRDEKAAVEKVTRDLNDIELSTNNMLLKIQSIKNKMGTKRDDSSALPFKDYVSQRMKRMQPPKRLDDVVREEEREDAEDDMDDGPMVEGFVDGLSHNCSTY